MAATSKLSHHDALNAHRRELIVNAAQQVFETHGLEAASIRSIAEAAGCTTGAIYPYFKGKEDVFAAVLRRSLEGLRQALAAAVINAGTADKALRRTTSAFFKYYDERPSELALALYLFNGIRPRKLGQRLDAELTRRLEAVLEVFATQIRNADSRPFNPIVNVEAMALFTYLNGLLILRHNGRIQSLNKNTTVLLAHYTRHLMHRLKSKLH